MADIGDLIDRARRDWLYPPDQQPARMLLAAEINSAVTTLTYTDDLLAPDEEDLLGEGVILEIDSELIQVLRADTDSRTLTITRGYNDTTAATHTVNSTIYIAPPFTRLAIFNAICDEIEALWPDLYAVATDSLTTSSSYAEVDTDAMAVLRYIYPNTSSGSSFLNYIEGSVQLLRDFPGVTSEVIVQFPSDVPSGRAGYFTYKKRFSRPTAETTTLTTLGVEEAWGTLIIIGAVAQLLARTDISTESVEFITEALESEAFPVGTGGDIRDNLVRYQQFLLSRAKRQLRKQYPERVRMNLNVQGV